MKTHAAFAKLLLVVASLGLSASLMAQAPAKRQPTPAPAPAQQEETAKAEDTEGEDVIPGTVFTRKNGAFLSITIENNCFKLAFYDEKKKPVAPDVARASIRWSPRNKKGDERRVMNPSGDGMTFIAPPPVQPPHNFRVYVTLLSENDEAAETLNGEFRQ